MDTETILRAVRELQELGVCWLGLTGGEPLLNPDIARIVAAAADGCAVKLFTTGSTLTREKALALKQAGLFSVSVSLDHWQAGIHDRNRGLEGAFATALQALRIFKETGGIQVGVSAVISRDMLRSGQVEEFLEFLRGLDIDEAWLCEAKPSVAAFWNEDMVISAAEQQQLAGIQDRANRRAGMTVNYLGHFESREFFGCNAGFKMVFIDACGEVSPCVFTPMTFGNIRQRPLQEIFARDEILFPFRKHLLHQQELRPAPRRRPRPGVPGPRRVAAGRAPGANSGRCPDFSVSIFAAAGRIKMKSKPLRLYRSLGLAMALSLRRRRPGLFFFCPRASWNSSIASPCRWAWPRPRSGPGAFSPSWRAAYMVLVTALAWLMFRKPANPCSPQLLALGKLASALLSLAYFFGRRRTWSAWPTPSSTGASACWCWG